MECAEAGGNKSKVLRTSRRRIDSTWLRYASEAGWCSQIRKSDTFSKTQIPLDGRDLCAVVLLPLIISTQETQAGIVIPSAVLLAASPEVDNLSSGPFTCGLKF